MATFLKKQQLWQARRRINGKRKPFYGKTAEEAEAFANEAVGIVCALISDEGTIREFVRTTIAPRYERKAAATLAQWIWAMDTYILPTIGDLACEDFKPKHVHQILAKVKGKGWTVRTVRKHLFPLCRLLARQQLIPYNYLEEVEAPEVETGVKSLTIEQAHKLYVASSPPVKAIVLLAGFLGLRRGELLAVKSTDVAPIMAINDQRVYVRGKGVVTKTKLKTRTSERAIPIPAVILAELQKIAGHVFLVSASDGTQPTPTSFRKMLHRECEAAKVPLSSVHSLRHTFSATLDEMGCPRSVKNELMGHGKSEVSDVYTDASDASKILWLTKLWQRASTQAGIEPGHTTSSSSGIENG